MLLASTSTHSNCLFLTDILLGKNIRLLNRLVKSCRELPLLQNIGVYPLFSYSIIYQFFPLIKWCIFDISTVTDCQRPDVQKPLLLCIHYNIFYNLCQGPKFIICIFKDRRAHYNICVSFFLYLYYSIYFKVCQGPI